MSAHRHGTPSMLLAEHLFRSQVQMPSIWSQRERWPYQSWQHGFYDSQQHEHSELIHAQTHSHAHTFAQCTPFYTFIGKHPHMCISAIYMHSLTCAHACVCMWQPSSIPGTASSGEAKVQGWGERWISERTWNCVGSLGKEP